MKTEYKYYVIQDDCTGVYGVASNGDACMSDEGVEVIAGYCGEAEALATADMLNDKLIKTE